MARALILRPLAPSDAERCDAIMRSLPEYFSYEPGLADCAQAVRTQAGWVAESDGKVVGFATWTPRAGPTAEITWAAVAPEHHHEGIGSAIVEELLGELRDQGFLLALVMTSAAHKTLQSGPDPYDGTRAFWAGQGFLPLIEMDIWETDIALLMVRPLLAQARPARVPPEISGAHAPQQPG